MKLPKIKKSIESYALNEDGKISKQSLLSMGALLGSAALAGILNSKDSSAHVKSHVNNITLHVLDNTATGQDTHHASY